MVKFGYQIERMYPDIPNVPQVYCPNVTELKAYSWKVNCPPKLKHFLWQIVSGCYRLRKI